MPRSNRDMVDAIDREIACIRSALLGMEGVERPAAPQAFDGSISAIPSEIEAIQSEVEALLNASVPTRDVVTRISERADKICQGFMSADQPAESVFFQISYLLSSVQRLILRVKD